MSVGFNSPGYEAGERDGVEVEVVCLDLSGQTERNVNLTLAAVGGTATSQYYWIFSYIKI